MGSRQFFYVIVRMPESELSHVAGFYNAYVAILDETKKQLLSPVKLFSADKGQISIFKGKDISCVFFAGSVTYNGWTDWDGGLWKAGSEWTKKWPVGEEYWKGKAIEIESDGLKISARKTKPSPDKVIPDCTWEYIYA